MLLAGHTTRIPRRVLEEPGLKPHMLGLHRVLPTSSVNHQFPALQREKVSPSRRYPESLNQTTFAQVAWLRDFPESLLRPSILDRGFRRPGVQNKLWKF